MKPPWKWNETQQNSFRNAQIFIHSVTTDETPKIQIWLVIELTDSESFIFFVFVCQKLTAIEKKNLVSTRKENFVEILFI